MTPFLPGEILSAVIRYKISRHLEKRRPCHQLPVKQVFMNLTIPLTINNKNFGQINVTHAIYSVIHDNEVFWIVPRFIEKNIFRDNWHVATPLESLTVGQYNQQGPEYEKWMYLFYNNFFTPIFFVLFYQWFYHWYANFFQNICF